MVGVDLGLVPTLLALANDAFDPGGTGWYPIFRAR